MWSFEGASANTHIVLWSYSGLIYSCIHTDCAVKSTTCVQVLRYIVVGLLALGCLVSAEVYDMVRASFLASLAIVRSCHTLSVILTNRGNSWW